jgi:cobalt-zinc-cadmium efflux system membrane fusion protein
MKRVSLFLSTLLVIITVTFGCGKHEAVSKPATDSAGTPSGGNVLTKEESAWWCIEHGIPEAICSMCDSKVAADLQKKGDWCKEHDRAESQCFICNPELETKFAAQFEAKFGRKPPKP